MKQILYTLIACALLVTLTGCPDQGHSHNDSTHSHDDNTQHHNSISQ